jgi:hypothetical protein
LELIDAECRELLGLAGTRIFSNIQRLRPDLNLEEVLQRPSPPTPGTPDHAVVARAGRLDIALRWLQAIYACPRAPASESSSSGDTSGSKESGSEEAEDDGAMDSSEGASSSSSHGTDDDEGDVAVAQ